MLSELPRAVPITRLSVASVGVRGSAVDRPTVRDALAVGAGRDAIFRRHINRHAPVFRSLAKATVAGLLLLRRPSAILGAVSSVIVNAVDRQIVLVSIRLRPFIERLKRLPLFADTNASGAIMAKAMVVRIEAAGSHQLPDIVQPTAGLAMRSAEQANALHTLAATALRAARAKIRTVNRALCAAIASRKPKRGAARVISCLPKNKPMPERLPRQVNQSRILCHAN